MANDSGGPGGPSPSERDRQYCELCGKMENLLRCSRCRSSFYCSKEHQRQDWKKHKLVCQGGEGALAPGAGQSQHPGPAPPPRAAGAGAREARKAAPRRDRAAAAAVAEAAGPRAAGDAAMAKAKAKPPADPVVAASPPRAAPGGQGSAAAAAAEADPAKEEPLARSSLYQEKANLYPPSSAPGEALSHGGGLRPNGQTKPLPALKLALEYIVPCMNKHGICVVDDFLGKETGQQIGDEVRALHDTGKFTDGQLVSQKSDSSKDIRGDKITWIEGKEPGCETIGLLMSSMDDLIRHCNGKLGNYKINGRTKSSIQSPHHGLLDPLRPSSALAPFPAAVLLLPSACHATAASVPVGPLPDVLTPHTTRTRDWPLPSFHLCSVLDPQSGQSIVLSFSVSFNLTHY
ncbi:egl nine homolog 1 isoform X2 [Delphinapterus leucas]|uniref:Egl nine homolog 1 isoform X2 n=1 Tax=Delphinapterus leucas TaxID=9749 RepID=A0A7F8K981_DELLE|nr:egl nine homolog 1 isoform X2 [Delphinapterus leucas]